MKMISEIGINFDVSPITKIKQKKGLTFIEMMVTLVIISLGIVGIFTSLLSALDQTNYLTNRLYAAQLLDNKIFQQEKMFRRHKKFMLDSNSKINMHTGYKRISFYPEINIRDINGAADIFLLDASLSWMEAGKKKKIKRSAYIMDPSYESKK